MKKYGKKGFTLIELIAVLVIMAIIALIVTPLVMSIIRKSKISARKRSVDAYGRSVELAIASYLLDTGTFPTDLHSLTIEYSGNTVVCNVMQMKENGGLYMSECSVNNIEVKDNSTEDGWYHYGTRDLTNAEYVDMYGKNVEAALKLYHDTNNVYPETIDNLTIESVGKTVACESSINYDGTVYLTNCKVDGVSVSDTNQEDGYYHYGGKKNRPYVIGDQITYNNVDFYVIADSDDENDEVTMLKAEPLTVDEVNEYGVGHVNRYTPESVGTAKDKNGYGGMAFYSSKTCGKNGSWTMSECTNDYSQSDIKYVVDAWANDKFTSSGYSEARLITEDELVNNLGYSYRNNSYWNGSNTPSWVYNGNYGYWTMIPSEYNNYIVYYVSDNGVAKTMGVYDTNYMGAYVSGNTVRPVITIKKSAL